MSAALQKFLAARLPFPGLAAWGARFTDHSVAQQCYSQWLAPEQVQQTLSRLTVAGESLRQHHLDPIRLCWVFEHLRIHIASRADGACVALFVENRPEISSAGIDKLLSDFANQRAASAT